MSKLSELIAQLCQALNNTQKPQERFDLPGELILVKDYEKCWLENINKLPSQQQKAPTYMVKLGQQYPIDKQQEMLVTTTREDFATDDQVMEMWLAPDQLPLM